MAARKPTKSPKKADKKTGRKTGTLVPQPHGGAILNGMAKNHVPGPGRTPNHVRQMAVELGIAKALPKLEAILDDPTSTKQEIISAAREVLGQVPRKDELNLADDPRVKRTIQRVAELVLEIAGPDVHAQIAARLAAEGL